MKYLSRGKSTKRISHIEDAVILKQDLNDIDSSLQLPKKTYTHSDAFKESSLCSDFTMT